MRRHKLRPALLLGAVIMALVLGVQPVAAVNVTHASGVFGYAVLQDAHFPKQGANCDHKTTKSNGVYPLKDMSVRTTRIYARDTSSGTDQQWVGWRFKIQRDINFDQSFSTLFTSSVMKAEATDTTPATFNRRKWTPAPKFAHGELPDPGHLAVVRARIEHDRPGQAGGPHRVVPRAGWRRGHSPQQRLLQQQLGLPATIGLRRAARAAHRSAPDDEGTAAGRCGEQRIGGSLTAAEAFGDDGLRGQARQPCHRPTSSAL